MITSDMRSDLLSLRPLHITSVIAQCKKPTAQMAHLVFSDTQANAQKTKRAIFLPTHGQTTRQLFKHILY